MCRRTWLLTLWAALGPACAALVPSDSQESSDGAESAGEGDSDSVAATADPPPDAPRPDPADIVVATFNVHLFFDARCDSGNCGSGDFEDAPNSGQFEYRARQIAEAIAALDADVVLLQEVETQAALDEVTARLDGAYPTAILGETGLPGSIDVAVLARDPTLEIRRHGDVPIPLPGGGKTWFAREFLEVHLDVGGHRVVVFAAHFKSKNDDDPERRLAEGTRAREIVDEAVAEHPDALLVLGGDLNDVPGSPPIAALEGEGGMLRVAAELAPEDWTYTYDDDHRAIDHLYLATAGAGGRFVEGSAVVFRGDGDDGYGGSDHAAVRASFRAE